MRDYGVFRRLKDIREDKDFTQANIAEYLGVDKSTYSKWETEKEVMPLKRVVAFSNITKKSLDYIIGFSSDSSDKKTELIIDKKEIGQRLKDTRLKLGYTQEALASILGSNQSCISGYETGVKLILSSYAFEICRLYNISFDWLIGGVGKENFTNKSDLS